MPLAKVLIVDDDPGVRRLLEIASREAGLEPLLATDGSAALELLLQSPPQVIVLDWEMPVMDGGEFLRALRDSGDDTPVIVVSAHRSLSTQVKPPDRMMPKPFDPFALIELINEVCATSLPAAAAG